MILKMRPEELPKVKDTSSNKSNFSFFGPL
jgi:hypothetical protein